MAKARKIRLSGFKGLTCEGAYEQLTTEVFKRPVVALTLKNLRKAFDAFGNEAEWSLQEMMYADSIKKHHKESEEKYGWDYYDDLDAPEAEERMKLLFSHLNKAKWLKGYEVV